MKKAILQYWEESERGRGIRPEGCSLHSTLEDRKKYVSEIYKNRTLENIPSEYEKICGEPIEVFIKVELYDIFENGNLRLSRNQLSNLIKLKEIII